MILLRTRPSSGRPQDTGLSRLLSVARRLLPVALGLILLPILCQASYAQVTTPLQGLDPLGPGNLTVSLKILLLLTILTIAPSILLLTTAFPRLVIVLGFVRRALSMQEVPPNQVIIGLALVLTFYVMTPTVNGIWQDAVDPYLNAEIDDMEALDLAQGHLRDFMWRQVDQRSLETMLSVANPEVELHVLLSRPMEDVSFFTLMPAFLLSELKRAFEMGFMLYLPFVVIDLVVASTLISMGMLVLPPVLISLPFKVLIFVLVDGWEIIVTQLARSF